MRNSILNNPLVVFLLCILIIITNLISSIYFTSVLLLGVLFLAFLKTLKNKQYYTFFIINLTLIIVETNMGFKPLTLSLLSFFSYLFIIPYIKRVMSMNSINDYFFVFWFYVAFSILWSFYSGFSLILAKTTVVNILIDFIIIGLFI